MSTDAQKKWQEYTTRELARLVPILEHVGFELEAEQPHLGGERFLMQAVTTEGGRKMILLGARKSDGKRVVIKTSIDTEGIQELEHEQVCRGALEDIPFAYEVFYSPEEILHTLVDGRLISIQEFIEQEKTFLERPLAEQFAIALRAFKAQESTRATTRRHLQKSASLFGIKNADTYLTAFEEFKNAIIAKLPEQKELLLDLERTSVLLHEHTHTIEQYGGFLTHTDFVPHNFRIVGDTLYLLDHSSLRFGNKYEGWARFLNYMSLYNPALERALTQYVTDNRSTGEVLSLKLMRIYRLGEIIWYYTDKLEKSDGNLHELNMSRVLFWGALLHAVLEDATLTNEQIESYKNTRDRLRSEGEVIRQSKIY